MVDVSRLKPLAGRALRLCVAELAQQVQSGGPMVEPLRDEVYFARVFVEIGAPTWRNGFDLDPINLYVEMDKAGLLRKATAA